MILKGFDYLCIDTEGNAARGVDEQYYPFFTSEEISRLKPEEKKELSEFAIGLWKKFGDLE